MPGGYGIGIPFAFLAAETGDKYREMYRLRIVRTQLQGRMH
jgi:hypothetical protein